MQDGPSSTVAIDPAVGGSEALNQPDVDRILADFRSWLESLRAFEPAGAAPAETAPASEVDLATLVGQFLALKQEVNLQTRASRGLLEQNTQTLEQLRQALGLLESQQEGGDRDENLRPLLKSLVDASDALALARREVQKMHDVLQPLLEQFASQQPSQPASSPPLIHVNVPWWARLLGLGKRIDDALARYHAWKTQQPNLKEQETRPETALLAQRVRQAIQSILTGYGMSLQRLERSIEQHGLEPIATVGEAFDPEQMEALEIVRDSGRAAGEVAEEVRRGYLWHGKVFRFAQVRVCQ